MRVFVTGASGWIGSAVVPELIGAGHQVVGLARSDASAAALTAAGAEVQRGTLDDLDVLRERRRGVGRGDPPRLQARHRVLRRLPGRRRRRSPRHRDASARRWPALIGRSSSPPARSGSRRDGWRPNATGRRTRPRRACGAGRQTRQATARVHARRSPRAASARRSCGSSDRARRRRQRLHGDARRRSPATRASRATSATAANRWPAVHRLDSARLFRLAVENAPAGSTLHAVADEGVPIRDIAEVIGRHLDVPVASIAPERRRRALHLAGRVPRARQPGVERADPRAAGLAADPARADRRPRQGHYFAPATARVE